MGRLTNATQISVPIQPELKSRLLAVAAANESNVAREVRIAVRKHVEREEAKTEKAA